VIRIMHQFSIRFMASGRTRLCFLIWTAMQTASCNPLPAPVVDMEGVNPVTYNRDLAACYEEKKWAIEAGNAISNCMSAKGYKVLVSH
jgi:hypothetical protein